MDVAILMAALIGVFLLLIKVVEAARKRTPRHRPIAKRDVAGRKSPPLSRAEGPPQSAKALEGPAYIIDGDSLVIRKTQVRLFGVDAPELNHPYGQKAKWALVGLCKGQIVRAEVTDDDDYGRTVAKCFLPDGRDLSAEMVKAGLAIDWPKFSGGVYRAFEGPGIRKKLWLADARQKGRMEVWERFQAKQDARLAKE